MRKGRERERERKCTISRAVRVEERGRGGEEERRRGGEEERSRRAEERSEGIYLIV